MMMMTVGEENKNQNASRGRNRTRVPHFMEPKSFRLRHSETVGAGWNWTGVHARAKLDRNPSILTTTTIGREAFLARNQRVKVKATPNGAQFKVQQTQTATKGIHHEAASRSTNAVVRWKGA